MMLQRLFFSILMAIPFLLLSGIAEAEQTIVPYEVVLKPNANGPTSEIHVEKGKQCQKNANPHDGCMVFSEDTIGEITFSLSGPPMKTICTDLTGEGAKRVITKIVLSTTQRQNDPKAGVYGDKVDPWLKQYAFADVDMSNGVIYEAGVKEGRTSVTLTNDNRHPHQSQPKSFWYQVTVTDCDDPGKKWVFDPRGDNEGKN